MSSRLDRLLVLLDTGSNSNVRITAAKQIAQLAVKSVRSDVPGDEWNVKHQKSPSTKDVTEYVELMAVVCRVLPYLHSKSFDTRTAASATLSHICTLLPVWSPSPPDSTYTPFVHLLNPLPFPPFSVASLLNTPASSLLLGSSGKEYTKPGSFRSPAEVAKARKEAMNRLGLEFLGGMSGMGEEETGMDWDKELAAEADAETSPVEAKGEPADVVMNHSTSRKPALERLQTDRLQGVKMEDSPSTSPTVRAVSEGSPSSSYVPSENAAASAYSVPPTQPSGEPQAELSARERNRLKRKRKAGTAFVAGAASQANSSTNGQGGPAGPPPPPKGSQSKYGTLAAGESQNKVRLTNARKQILRLRTPDGGGLKSSAPPAKVIIDPSKGGQVEAHDTQSGSKAFAVREGEWIWEGVQSVLEVDLFNTNWEVRHGAAMALRDIIKTQGANGGMKAGLSKKENEYLHAKWCNELAAKFLCILVLDRFGDFVTDQVVAPVRETVSQTLASLLLHMPRQSVLYVHDILLQMINQDTLKEQREWVLPGRLHVWEVRHAGLLGIKYEVAVRNDLVDDAEGEDAKKILRGVVDVAVLGLGDYDDDVRVVAASCLLPVASQIVQQLPDCLGRILDVLWNCLSGMKDDLSSSVGAVMELLGKLVTFNEVISILGDANSSRPLSVLAPMLFPFFRHTITNVRLAVVKTLHSFLQVSSLSRDWISNHFLRLLLQNLVVEEKTDVRDATLATWNTAIQVLCSLYTDSGVVLLEYLISPELVLEWHEIVMTPFGTAIDTSRLYNPTGSVDSAERHNIDKAMISQDFGLVSQELILKGRVAAATALATLIHAWPQEQQKQDAMFGGLLKHYIVSASMLQRLLAAIIIEEWAHQADIGNGQPLINVSPLAETLGQTMLAFLDSPAPEFYHEMALNLTRLMHDCTSLLNSFSTDCKIASGKIPLLGNSIDITGRGDPEAFTLAKARQAVGEYFTILRVSLGRTKKREVALLEEKRKNVIAAVVQYEQTKACHDVRIFAAFAAVVVALRVQLPKLTPIIKSLTAGVRSEDNIDLQQRSAKAVASIVDTCARAGTLPPLQKIVKNLCAFLCQDTELTPTFATTITEGILSFQRDSGDAPPQRSLKGEKEPSLSEEAVKARLTRRGAHLAFVELSTTFGPSLFNTLPAMWDCMCGALLSTFKDSTPEAADAEMTKVPQNGQDVIDNLVILEATVPTLHEQLWPRLSELFSFLVLALRSRFAVVRQMAAQAFATICDVSTVDAMRYVLDIVLPLLGDSISLTNRQGAIELIYHIIRKLDLKALPYVIFLVVPVLGRMSDPNDGIRATATNSFASLVKMVPLEAGRPDPPGFSEELLKKRVSERDFLTQLLDGSKVAHYHIPVVINIELRKYQQDGVNWLAFLAKYQLHGILCDDMGLGKTLQSICILASKQFERAERFNATQSLDAVHLPSIVICPPTLTGHWSHEILKYTNNLKPLVYFGTAKERSKMLSSVNDYDVVITSYEVVRNDIFGLAKIHWHYCILDEGHVIKNSKTKLTKAVKLLRAHHRLILSGTPIQNNVLELWSLFDFLMPGFLGTEFSFHERFGKPILSTRDGKASAKNHEAAALALEALHKQVLPFLLRRLKEDVLSDLPPKIIQDYYCELSDVQKQLYDDFGQSQAKSAAEETVKGGKGAGQQHVFQSLQYLRKLCNHPALVLKGDEATIQAIMTKVHGKVEEGSLHDIQHAPKLQALRQLLIDCGIGGTSDTLKGDLDDIGDTTSGVAAFSQHRVLIFCQLKQMLNIIETDLFKKHMPSVTYMRLDGNTDPGKRHAIVQTFNSDPSIDVLLLTTHVGGLGLTLTGADTVIFVEHDWNPMKDLQAMDRAHRLGQKKVVNVYRLITKGTLEEKIMGLQRFKLNIASSVITQQNSGLESMNTDLVLDLFRRTTEAQDPKAAPKNKEATGPASQKHVLEGLEELPPEEEYEGLEFSSFLGSIGR